MKHFYFLLLLLSSALVFGQKLEGTVLDSRTGEPLPSVSILYNASKSLGTTTDLNGRFTIPDRSQINKLEITFIGYEPVTIPAKEIPPRGDLTIDLVEITTELAEAEVGPGENPALRIIRNAIARADSNDPKKYNTYKFKSYNKNVLTKALDSTFSAVRQLNLMESDTTQADLKRFLMVSEAVSITKFKKPDLFNEEIIGTQISGFKNSIYAVGAENIQYFGLYDDVIQVLTEYYITPLAKGATNRYFYILQDTTFHGQDTTYIMYYQPKIGSNFEGLKGEIHINTDGWAMEYVSAEPYYKGNIDFAIEHYYQQVQNGNWFPQKLLILLHLERMPMFNQPGFIHSELFVDSVQLNLPLSDKEFNHVKRELSADAPYVDDKFWDDYRPEKLNVKEVRTYEHMDSVGERYKFDFFMNAARNIYRGFFTVGQLELKVNKFIRYTGYEGLRIGAGVYTNSLFSKKVRFGGYYGYGFNDKGWKYGGTFEYFFDWENDHKLRFDYSSDLMQPGVVNIGYYYNTNFWTTVWASHMDRMDEAKLTYKRRLSTFMTLETSLRKFDIYSNNEYRFFDPENPDSYSQDHFSFSEINLNWRWAYREKITSNFGHQISAGTDFPVVMLEYGHGFKDILGGQYEYNRLEFGTWLERYIKGWGFLDVRLEAGYVDRPIPYQLLFSNRATYSPTFSFVNDNSFQTMRFNEFFADKYASLFLNHNFGSLLFRTNWFQPEFSLYHAMSFGTLQNPEYHNNLDFKTLEHGYYEVGAVLSNIFHIEFFKVGYMGFGGGVFYRYGPYQLPNEHENWAARISIIYTIN